MAEREAKGVLEGRRILVVEDETVIALWVEDVLKQAGATVLGPVASVSEALVLMERETFDCAVLNYKLPDGTITPVADLLVRAACHSSLLPAMTMARPIANTHIGRGWRRRSRSTNCARRSSASWPQPSRGGRFSFVS